MKCLNWVQFKRVAKLGNVERSGNHVSASYRHLKMIGHRLVNTLHKINGRVTLCQLLFHLIRVRLMHQQNSKGELPIPACPTGLLVVIFQGRGSLKVHHQSNIRFINTHSKGIGRHHYANPVMYPFLLSFFLFIRLKPRMKEGGRQLVFVE